MFEKPLFNLQVDTEALISYATLEQQNPEDFVNDWGANSFITFVKLNEQSNPRAIEQKMSELTLLYKPEYAVKNKVKVLTNFNSRYRSKCDV